MPPHHHQVIMNRFVAACQADARVVAATLYGSYARDAADTYSDLDLGLITTDAAYEDFVAKREAVIRLLGEAVVPGRLRPAEPGVRHFPGGTEVELALGHESQFHHTHGGPYKLLLDKNLLAGAVFPGPNLRRPSKSKRCAAWSPGSGTDLSHFIAAMGRGQLWWAYGQLEALRRYCVNLSRLRHDFAAAAEGYEKVEQAIPVEQLSALQATYCPLEPGAMLQAGRHRPLLSGVGASSWHGYGITARLISHVMSDRLEQLPHA